MVKTSENKHSLARRAGFDTSWAARVRQATEVVGDAMGAPFFVMEAPFFVMEAPFFVMEDTFFVMEDTFFVMEDTFFVMEVGFMESKWTVIVKTSRSWL